MDKLPITLAGLRKMEAELKHLKTVERPNIIEAIAVARDHGDLSENAEYSSAKEKQSFIEGRIQELEGKIALADVIDPTKIKSEKIMFGATVTLVDVETEKEVTYSLVGTEEANLDKGLISVGTPIARALLGKTEGDEVTVQAPGRTRVYEVVKVAYKEIKLD
jgi:transcription elongation factor GreA